MEAIEDNEQIEVDPYEEERDLNKVTDQRLDQMIREKEEKIL